MSPEPPAGLRSPAVLVQGLSLRPGPSLPPRFPSGETEVRTSASAWLTRQVSGKGQLHGCWHVVSLGSESD